MSAVENIQDAANKHYASRFDDEMRELVRIVDECTDDERYEDTLQTLQETPLSFQKLVTYHRLKLIDWEILLGTGGPADRVIVKTDFDGRIISAEYQYQDWFEAWTTAEDQDDELVQRFAEIVGYYESDE